MYQRVFFGQVKVEANRALPDLDARERLALWPMAAAALAMGVIPLVWISAIDPAVAGALHNAAQITTQVFVR
jgi:NADH-quinone oxidoreductase subunit M